MRVSLALSWILLLTAGALSQGDAGYVPRADYVPYSATAIKIAEAVLAPVYGKKQIDPERPFTAALKDGIWTVGGTLKCPDGKGGTTTECAGGVAMVRIAKRDARILYMMHGK